MAASPGDRHVNLVGGGHLRTGPVADDARGDLCRHMDGERPVWPRRHHVEQAFIEHVARPMAALLSGLEHEDDVPGNLRSSCAQNLRRAGEHGRVEIVPARMHGTLDLAREVEVGVLGHVERVHVAAQHDCRPGKFALEDGDDAARVLVQVDVERQTIECFEHPATCFGQVIADLRKAVQSPPERNDLGEDGSGGSEKGIGAHDASS